MARMFSRSYDITRAIGTIIFLDPAVPNGRIFLFRVVFSGKTIAAGDTLRISDNGSYNPNLGSSDILDDFQYSPNSGIKFYYKGIEKITYLKNTTSSPITLPDNNWFLKILTF